MASSNTIKDQILALFPDNNNKEISAADMRVFVNAIFDTKEEIVVKIPTAAAINLHKTQIFEKSIVIVEQDTADVNGIYLSNVNNPISILQCTKIANLDGSSGGGSSEGNLKSDGTVPMDVGYTPIQDQDISTKKYVDDTLVGGGGLDPYVRPTPMDITVGGATSGTTFDGIVADALDKILYPFVPPAFTSFSMSGQATVIEVGNIIVAGTKTFNWASSYPNNIEVNSIVISGDTVFASGLANTGTAQVAIPEIIKTSQDRYTFKIQGTNTESDLFSRNYYVNWYWRVYYGSTAVPTMTETDMESLQESLLTNTENRTYNCPANNYKWICYPTSFGLASKFTDVDTGFGVAMESPQTLSATNTFGIQTDYYCYRSTNLLVGSIRIKIG